MKKLLAGLAIAILFFIVGRNQPAIVGSVSHVATNEVQQFEKTQQPKNSDTTSKQSAENTEAEAQASLLFQERLITLIDSELFETLFSKEFKTQWQSALPSIKQRLFSPLPNIADDAETYEKEVTARLGILKALGKINEENNDELKEFLSAYLEHTSFQKAHPWLLQREAAHTLTQNNDLSEEEQNKAAGHLDPRARNTAAHPDVELLERSIAGDQ